MKSSCRPYLVRVRARARARVRARVRVTLTLTLTLTYHMGVIRERPLELSPLSSGLDSGLGSGLGLGFGLVSVWIVSECAAAWNR